MFSGNKISFGSSRSILPPVLLHPTSVAYPKPRNSRSLGKAELLGIIVAGGVLGIMAFALLILVCYLRRKKEHKLLGKLQKGEMSP